MGGYDLHGTYYPNINDAINAEMAQCAAIDADIAMREVNKMKKRLTEQLQPNPLIDEFQNIWQHIKLIEERLDKLEGRQ
jgi:signal recognition particle GTPase